MLTGETLFDAMSVHRDVLHHALPDRFAGSLDGLETTGHTHLLGGEVGVSTRTVPVTLHRLGVPVDVHAVVLGDALEQPASNPELVSHGHRAEDADLKLPLRHHHFSVGAFDRKTRAQASERVCFDDVTAGHLGATDAAVVRTLRSRETGLGPAVGTAVLVEGVLLLDTEPRLVLRAVLLFHRDRLGARVR